MLEWGCTYDQLNLGELVVFESIARRYQLWDKVYSSSLREAESGDHSLDCLDERHIFLGHQGSRGHALVCPALEEWVADRLQKEASVLN